MKSSINNKYFGGNTILLERQKSKVSFDFIKIEKKIFEGDNYIVLLILKFIHLTVHYQYFQKEFFAFCGSQQVFIVQELELNVIPLIQLSKTFCDKISKWHFILNPHFQFLNYLLLQKVILLSIPLYLDILQSLQLKICLSLIFLDI